MKKVISLILILAISLSLSSCKLLNLAEFIPFDFPVFSKKETVQNDTPAEYEEEQPVQEDIPAEEEEEAPTGISLSSVYAGNYLKFGAYEQDNNLSNGREEIEWLILEVKDGRALLISKYALDCQQYNTDHTNVTWETCTLRQWLNNDFINAAFSADEKAIIPTVTVSADQNPDYNTYSGNATQDQIFLLSMAEAYRYFSSDSARQCKPTNYAVANGADVNSSDGICQWWVRSPGDAQDSAASIYYNGDGDMSGYFVYRNYIAVRPALWIDLN